MSCFSAYDLGAAAQIADLDIAHIYTVAKVEAPRGPFYWTGHPTILFERHIFHRRTGGRFDRVAPDLSSPNAGGYGSTNSQPERLRRARDLDDDAAVQSCSWGSYQIMGFNHVDAGFERVCEFELAMRRSAREQLLAFARILVAWELVETLRRLDFAAFARRYNGPAYRRNLYDEKLEDAWKEAIAMGLPGAEATTREPRLTT